MTPSYQFQRGETLNITVEVERGPISAVSSVRARMKKVKPGRHNIMPGNEVPPISLTVTKLEPAEGFNGGWNFSMSPSATRNLAAGLYLVDAVFNFGGQVYIDGPVLIEILNSAAGANP